MLDLIHYLITGLTHGFMLGIQSHYVHFLEIGSGVNNLIGGLGQILAEGPDIGGRLTQITNELKKFGRLLAVFGVVAALVFFIITRAVPGLMQEQRGTILGICAAAFGIGLMPEVVGWLADLGSASAK